MKKLALLLGIVCWAGAAIAQTKTPDMADQNFVKDAAKGGMMEVSSGKLAAARGGNATVRSFGNRMIRDHSAANEKLKKLAAAKGITLPDAPDDDASLSKENGSKFDRDYVTMMLKDHKDDVADFEKAAKDLKDPDIRAFAHSTLPVLKEHLIKIKAIAVNMGIKD